MQSRGQSTVQGVQSSAGCDRWRGDSAAVGKQTHLPPPRDKCTAALPATAGVCAGVDAGGVALETVASERRVQPAGWRAWESCMWAVAVTQCARAPRRGCGSDDRAHRCAPQKRMVPATGAKSARVQFCAAPFSGPLPNTPQGRAHRCRVCRNERQRPVPVSNTRACLSQHPSASATLQACCGRRLRSGRRSQRQQRVVLAAAGGDADAGRHSCGAGQRHSPGSGCRRSSRCCGPAGSPCPAVSRRDAGVF